MRVVAETVILREIEDSRFLVNSRRTSKRASSKIHYALKYLRVLLCTKNYLVSNFTHKDYICDCLNRDKRYISCRVWIIVQRICVYIVTNGTARVVSQSSCEDYGFACQIIKKSETTRCKVGQHDQEKLNCHRYITSQFAYHNFSTAGGIIRRLLPRPRPRLLLIHKIAVGKREAVAFKYRLKSILSCWCQPAPLAIPL